MKIEVWVMKEQVDGIVSKIVDKLARTDMGGKIFVVAVARAIDLATKKQEENAL